MNKDVIYPSMVIRAQEETINKLEDEVNKQAKAIQIYEKELRKYDNNWNELKEFILNHYIVGHTVQNGSLDMIINKMKELENGNK